MSKLRSDELVNMEGDGAPSFPQGATSIEPTADNQVATKLYVDSALSAASGNAVSATAPINPAVGSFWTDTSVSPSLLKTWNGSMWIEFAGTASAAVGVVVSLPSLSATNLEHAPATITASAAQVSGATLFITKWYKDDVEIVGATGSTYVATEPGVYRYEERWADNAGNVLTPSLNKTIELLAIEAPSITIPVAGTGLTDFDYTAESSAIANVGTVDVLSNEDAFNTTIYSGNDSASQPALLDIGVDFTGKWLSWIKNRDSSSYDHFLSDSEHRTGDFYNYFASNATYGKQAGGSGVMDTSSTGYTLAGGGGDFNKSGFNYVAWNFCAAPNFFDVVTYTGSGATMTVPHNLGSTPGMIIIKGTTISGSNWAVYHKELDVNDVAFLNYTSQASEDSSNRFAGVHPTSTEFTVGTSPDTNYTGSEYVAYVFADNPSNEIKCGSYLGNAVGGGSPTVPNQIDCGFRPKFLLIKNAGNDTDWHMFDDQRGDKWIEANSSDTEGFGDPAAVVFNDNGFSLPTGYHHVNQDNTEHIYLAIGSPKITVSNTQLTLTDTTVSKVSDGTAVSGSTIDQVLTVGETVKADTVVSTTSTATVFSTTLYKGNSNSGGSGQTQTVNTGVNLVDGDGLIIFKQRTGSQPWRWHDTIRGMDYALQSHNDGAQFQTDQVSVNSTGFTVGAQFPYNQISGVDPNNLEKHVAWTFRKAPGFFDIVTWSGNDVQNRAIPHSLGTTPGCIIVKELGTREWYVYHSGSNLPWTGGTTEGDTSGSQDTGTLVLDKTNAFDSSWGIFTYANSTAFGVRRSNSELNYSGGNYVAYVFAEDTPLIKCGTFSSSGETVNLGFRPQWIMMKSVDNTGAYTGNWRIFDTARGIVNGDGDASLYFNEDLPENTNAFAQAIAVNETGFTVEAQGAYGSSTIYVAIAENAEADITSDIYASGTVSASTGNTITLSNTTGTWSTGMKVQGVTTDTKDYPDPIDASAVTFASSQPVVTSGTVSAWDYAEWNLSYDSQFSSVVHEKAVPLTATGTQAGPDSFPIQAGTEYFVRTKYASSLPSGQSDWSAVTRFLTKANVYVDDLFSTFLYEGNGSSQSINNGIDFSDEGGLVWIKRRDSSNGHFLVDTERGRASNLNSASTSAAGTSSADRDLVSFNNNGFTVGPAQYESLNASGADQVSWSFRKAPGFFDIVTYTGNGTAGRTVSHNLGSVPGFIIIKATSTNTAWYCYHRSLGKDKYLRLDVNEAAGTFTILNSVDPTNTEFTLSGTGWNVNENNVTYVAYLFAHDDQSFGANNDESIVKCGSYTGNGSETGPVIDLGFEPQWLLIKRTSSSDPWILFDNMRGMANGVQDPRLEPNTSDAEDVFAGVNVLPTGFELASSTGFQNSSGQTYIYMAIRRPHKPPTAGTDVFTAAYSNGGIEPSFDSNNHVVDFGIYRRPTTTENWYTTNRLTAPKYLRTNSTDEESGSAINYDYQHGFADGASSDYFAYMFRRAPGFLDVVTYTGTGSARTVSHNLGVAPELMIVKRRSDTGHWYVYDATLGDTYVNLLSAYSGSFTSSAWNNTSPTSSVFTVSSSDVNNNGASFVAYLFASLDGISKVGSYTGTGGNVDVDCGFAAGARFVLIKRTDSTGDWYVWDTARGIVSGNDPYLLLNETAAEVTNTDYIDPLNAGFTVTSSAPAALNASGGTYLFLAIA